LFYAINVMMTMLTFCALSGTTGSDVLYAGVPVITLPSARTLGRMGASLLSRVGLSLLIVRSESEFVRTAAALMRNRTA
jgi:protein O-GlcNAc transferase